MSDPLIEWGRHARGDEDEVVGWLPGERETTLFIYSRSSRLLVGAFIPDEDEQRRYKDFQQAHRAAESYLREWIEKHGDLIFKIRAEVGGVDA